jgi:hypothetical protein
MQPSQALADRLWFRRLHDRCHQKQRGFVADDAPRVAACCSRRAGKSVGVLVRHALLSMRYPHETSVYINRSVAAGISVLGPALRGLQREGVDCRITQRMKNGRTYWVFPSGHRLWIAGCKDRSEIDNFRGSPYPGVTIDEAQQFPYLAELVEDSIEPALLDFNGWLALIGTPSPIPIGMFFEASRGEHGWSQHHWTMLDNPYLPDAANWLRNKREKSGWTESHPRYRREYLGEWVLDGDALVYPLQLARNGAAPMPDGARTRVLGVDLGSTGTTAFVVVATVCGWPGYWVEHCSVLRGASVSRVCDEVRRLRTEYDAYRVVVDAGGLGGAYVEELRTRYGIAAEAAVKQHKLAYIEHIRSDILAGLLHVSPAARDLWDEAAALQWRDDRSGYDDRMPDHCLDALLYAWRALRPEREADHTPPPEPGTPEWYEREAREARDARRRQVERARRERMR